MKISTFNVNGINGRLPVLLRWLAETEPDVVCLQEIKATQEIPKPQFARRVTALSGTGRRAGTPCP
jgi:exonuclease III